MAIAAFTYKFPGVQPQTRQAIHNINVGFEETGIVADLMCTRELAGPSSARYKENLQILEQAVIRTFNMSLEENQDSLKYDEVHTLYTIFSGNEDMQALLAGCIE